MMRGPCWKAANAQIRKRKAEQEKTEVRIQIARQNGWADCRKYSRKDVGRDVIRLNAECVINPVDKYRMPFEERLDYAKHQMFKKMYEQISQVWTLEHRTDDWAGDEMERWKAELFIVKGTHYL